MPGAALHRVLEHVEDGEIGIPRIEVDVAFFVGLRPLPERRARLQAIGGFEREAAILTGENQPPRQGRPGVESQLGASRLRGPKLDDEALVRRSSGRVPRRRDGFDLAQQGVDPLAMDTATFDRFVRSEVASTAELAKALDLKPQ